MGPLQVENRLRDKGLLVGIVKAEEIKISDSPSELKELISQLILRDEAAEDCFDQMKAAVRDMLRRGGFKPSGRNKPASEYLLQAAREDRFPSINNLVDINNFISLKFALPCSILDYNTTGSKLLLRYGLPSEEYIFNRSGQVINLEGLICVCANSEEGEIPMGNPIKDSMLAKLKDKSSIVIGVVYAPTAMVSFTRMTEILDIFAELLKCYAGAKQVEIMIE